MHLATRGKQYISLVVLIPNSEEIHHRSSLKSYLYKVDAKSHPHTLSIQLHRHMHHVVTPGYVDRSHWSNGTAGQMNDEAG